MPPRKTKRRRLPADTEPVAGAPDSREIPTLPAPDTAAVVRTKHPRGALVDVVAADLSRDARYEAAEVVVKTSGTRARAKTRGSGRA